MAKARRERIYLVPRWPGVVLGIVTFALLLVFALGIMTSSNQPIPAALGISLLVAGLVALILTNENLRGVEVAVAQVPPVAAGDPARLELTVRNDSERERIGLEVRPGLRWNTAWKIWKRRESSSADVPLLQPGRNVTVRLPIPATQRGRHPLPEVWVASVIPVGLCFAWKRFAPAGHYIVHPRPLGRPLERVVAGGSGDLAGEASADGHEDVSGHRPYRAGDPLSRMDWRVFARTGEMLVRTLEGDRGCGEAALRWEDTGFLEDVEARLEQLSCWIDQCLREGRPFRLELPGARGDLDSRNPGACLEALATFPSGLA
jgi:uncharacterized protein (DUF58 family)